MCRFVWSKPIRCVSLVIGNSEQSEDLILEDWFKNDPINQIAGLEKQIKDLYDDKSVKSSLENELVIEESDLASQENDHQQLYRDQTNICINNELVNSHQDHVNGRTNGHMYSLPNDLLTKVCTILSSCGMVFSSLYWTNASFCVKHLGNRLHASCMFMDSERFYHNLQSQWYTM